VVSAEILLTAVGGGDLAAYCTIDVDDTASVSCRHYPRPARSVLRLLRFLDIIENVFYMFSSTDMSKTVKVVSKSLVSIPSK